MTAPGAAACPHCGAATREGARFCRACGRQLAVAATPSVASVDSASVAPVAPVAAVADAAEVRPPAASSDPDRGGSAAPATSSSPFSSCSAWLRGAARRWAVREPASAGSAPDSPEQRRRLRRRLLIGGALVIAVIAACAGATMVDRVVFPPDRAVRAFFDALAAKDTAAIRSLGGCRSGPLCDDKALDSGYVPPARLQIGDVRFGANAEGQLARLPRRTSAAVSVRYEVGGTGFDDVLTLRRAGWFEGWRLSSVPGWQLIVDGAQIPQVRVAAATVTARPEDQLGLNPAVAKVWALPGAYTVAVASDVLYTAEPVTVTVGGATRETTVRLEARLRDDLTADVNRQVTARVDACAAQATLTPDTDNTLLSGHDCPFSATSRYTILRNITWRITRYPRVELTAGAARTLAVRTVGDGEAVLSYDWSFDILEPRDWTALSETVTFSVGGQVTVGDDGKAVWGM